MLVTSRSTRPGAADGIVGFDGNSGYTRMFFLTWDNSLSTTFMVYASYEPMFYGKIKKPLKVCIPRQMDVRSRTHQFPLYHLNEMLSGKYKVITRPLISNLEKGSQIVTMWSVTSFKILGRFQVRYVRNPFQVSICGCIRSWSKRKEVSLLRITEGRCRGGGRSEPTRRCSTSRPMLTLRILQLLLRSSTRNLFKISSKSTLYKADPSLVVSDKYKGI